MGEGERCIERERKCASDRGGPGTKQQRTVMESLKEPAPLATVERDERCNGERSRRHENPKE